jgi:hypothetical protein
MGKDAHATAARGDARPPEGRDERLACPIHFPRTREPRVPTFGIMFESPNPLGN